MKYLWLWWNKKDLRTEYQQLADEGRDTSSVEAKFARLLAEDVPEDEQFQTAVNDLLDNARLFRYGLQRRDGWINHGHDAG